MRFLASIPNLTIMNSISFTDTQVTLALIVAIAVPVVLSLTVVARRSGRIVAKPLMTGNELQFYRRLVRAATAQGLVVLCQVGMAALLTHAGVSGKAMWRIRSRFDRLMVDYVALNRFAVIL